MENQQPKSENDQIITLNILNLGTIKIAKRYCFKENLQYLSQISKLTVTNEQGEELLADNEDFFPQLHSNLTYFLVDDEDLDLVGETGENMENKHAEYAVRLQRRIPAMEIARKTFIKQFYTPKHSYLFELTKNKNFLQLVENLDNTQILKHAHRETDSGIFSLVIFSKQFCVDLIEEVEYFQNAGLPLLRPNSMNRYGLILNEIGFSDFFSELLDIYMKPLLALLFGDIGASLDSHHSFIVQYKMTEDKKLNFHFDESEVTLNVCLGKEFTGGTLYFRGVLGDKNSEEENFEFNHVVGRSLLHLGKHSHGAKSITSGDRFNLIIWFRNSSLRTQQTHNDHEHQHHHHKEEDIHSKTGKEELNQ